LKYKHPYLINADAYQNINDELDVLDGETAVISSDSDQSAKIPQEPLSPLNNKRIMEEPAPQLIDDSKWDQVYCLPFFAKPGRHTYLIKFKDTKNRAQKRLIK
jgi:hypothetical protein